MLSGKRPFVGEDVSDTLATVLKMDPAWGVLPADTLPHVRQVLRTCLQKRPNERIHDIADVRLAMEGAFAAPVSGLGLASVSPQLRVWQRPAVIAVLLLATAVMAGLLVRSLEEPEAISSGLARFVILPPEAAPLDGAGFTRDLVISPDGQRVIYESLSQSTGRGLYARPIDQLAGTFLRGTEDGLGPVVSPDAQWVGFVTVGGVLQKVSMLGGTPVTLAELPGSALGLSWWPDDQIVFGLSGVIGADVPRGLFRVSADGGQIERLTTVDPEAGENSHGWPFIIPDRDAAVFVISTGAPQNTGQLAVLDLVTGDVTRLGLAGVSPHYVPTGHLVYASEDGAVHGVPFDVATFEVTGSPVLLIDSVAIEGSGAAHFSIADNGRLVYVPGTGGPARQRSLMWVDREGREEPLTAPQRDYVYPRLSPDGTRVALDVLPQNERDIWVWNLAAETLSRLTFAAERDTHPVWTPNGERILFTSERDGPAGVNVYWRAADGTGTAALVIESDLRLYPYAVTPDGTRMIAYDTDAANLMLVALEGDEPPDVLLGTDFQEWHAALSSDGAWLAIESDATGQSEVYVRPFPDVESGQWLVSTGGGSEPTWSRDGRELFYRSVNGMMTVPIRTDPTFTHGTPAGLVRGFLPYIRDGPQLRRSSRRTVSHDYR